MLNKIFSFFFFVLSKSRLNDLTAATFSLEGGQSTLPNSKTITLYNAVEGENQIIKFIEPCPTISWAGPLSRDRGFTINTKSTEVQQTNLKVTVFNPSFGTSTLKSLLNGRLENVYMMYRKTREKEADWVPSLIDLDDGAAQLDFTGCYAEEDAYGYTTLDWFHGGTEGSYDIMVQTKCNALGGPDEIDSFREVMLSGVIDLARPERYGEPLPFRESVMVQ